MNTGRIAIQQALVIELHLTYAAAARLMHVHPRTLWQHVQARNGSNVARWQDRTLEQRTAAIAIARILAAGA